MIYGVLHGVPRLTVKGGAFCICRKPAFLKGVHVRLYTYLVKTYVGQIFSEKNRLSVDRNILQLGFPRVTQKTGEGKDVAEEREDLSAVNSTEEERLIRLEQVSKVYQMGNVEEL